MIMVFGRTNVVVATVRPWEAPPKRTARVLLRRMSQSQQAKQRQGNRTHASHIPVTGALSCEVTH